MRLTVKVLNGEECTIAASPSSTVTDMKEQVSALMSIAVPDQKLIYMGKTLVDDKKLSEYNVRDGGKLILVVKRSSEAARNPVSFTKTTVSASAGSSPVWSKLLTFLRRHFTEKDAELVLAEFRKEFEKGLSCLSLDDIDRLAATKLCGVGER